MAIARTHRCCQLLCQFAFCLALLLLAGCAERLPLQPQDVAGQLWLHTAPDSRVEGFYTGADGRLLLISLSPVTGVSWSLQDDQLRLKIHDADGGEADPLLLQMRRDGNRLLLASADDAAAPGFVRTALQEPLSRKPYLPVYLRGSEPAAGPPGSEPVYLQFDTAEQTVHGFGGVNNFHGRYQRHGATGFTFGPLASTMMSGPGMDYELLLLSGIEQVDTCLAVDDRLLFYRGATLLFGLQLQ